MPQTVTGVIARTKGAEVELVDIVVPDSGPARRSSGSSRAGFATRTRTAARAGSTTTSHGDATVIGAEAPDVQEWLDAGH